MSISILKSGSLINVAGGSYGAAISPSAIFLNRAAFPQIGETNKIYVALDTKTLYLYDETIQDYVNTAGVDESKFATKQELETLKEDIVEEIPDNVPQIDSSDIDLLFN